MVDISPVPNANFRPLRNTRRRSAYVGQKQETAATLTVPNTDETEIEAAASVEK